MTAGVGAERRLALRNGREVLIRRAEPEDAGALLAYLGKVGGETINLTFGAEGPGLTEAEEREYLTRVAASDNSLAIVATMGDEIVGSLTFDGGRRARLRHVGEFGISVAQAYAGQGVGKALIEYMLAWAERGGVVRKINLKVRVDNAPAIRLYERMGWVTEGRTTRDTLIDGEFNDCLMMGRDVDPGDGLGPGKNCRVYDIVVWTTLSGTVSLPHYRILRNHNTGWHRLRAVRCFSACRADECGPEDALGQNVGWVCHAGAGRELG